jgi:hypothetical protein
MILPHGLELPRVLVQLIVNIYSADVLLNYKATYVEKFRNRLANMAYEWIGSHSEFFYLSSGENNNENESVVLEMENLSESEEKKCELSNLFVQITFSGVTVRFLTRFNC